MRISHQMLHQNSMSHMNQNLSRMEKTSNQVSTGKLLHRPSDDPIGVSKSMNLKSAIAANDQYVRNTNEANLWLDETDQTISKVVNVMQRARELAVQGSNDTLSNHDRTTIAAEVEELSEQIRQFAASKVNGKDLFTSAKTFTIGEGVVIQANVTADELFGNAEDDANLFQTLTNLVEGLRSDGPIPLEQINVGIERMLTHSSEVGARQNRVEAIKSRMEDSNLALQSMLSKIEDIDYAEAVTKLKSEESIYQASLAATAKIIQLSLMDFLR